jgi:membrane protease YdiL (CAAX protease family)
MTTLDGLYVALIAVHALVDHFVFWRPFLRRSETDPARARRWLWSGWILTLWTLVAAGCALWLFEARAWASLGFTVPLGWRLWVAMALVLAYAGVSARLAVKIARARRTKRVKFANPSVVVLAPHTGSELGHWVALSLTAGFGEEFAYRGYLIWVFQPLLGLWAAAALSLAAFVLAHSYQGVQGVPSTLILGAVFTLAVLMLGSLWPAVALHAVADIGNGLVAWLAVRRVPGEGEASPVHAGEGARPG